MSKFCTKCGKMLSDDSLFCSACGSKQSEINEVFKPTQENATTPITPAIKKKSIDNEKIIEIIKHSLVTLLSVIMFISSFLPFLTFNVKYSEEKINLYITPLDSVIFSIDSLYSMSNEDIKDSDLYAEYITLNNDLEDLLTHDKYDNEIDNEAEKLINQIFITYIRLYCRLETTETSLLLILTGILSLSYIILSGVFLTFSTLKLLSVLGVINKSYKSTFNFIPIVLSIFIGALTTKKLYYNIDNFGIPSKILDASIGSGAILVIVISLITLIGFAIIRKIYERVDKPKNLVGRLIATAISTLLIVTLLMPALTAKIYTTFESSQTKKTVSVDVQPNIYDGVVVKESEQERIEQIKSLSKTDKLDYFSELFSDFEKYTSREVKQGDANNTINLIMYDLLKSKTPPIAHFIFSLAPLFIALAIIFSGGITATNLYYFATGEMNKKFEITSKVLALIFTATYFVINLIFAIVINSFASIYIGKGYSLVLSVENVISLIISIVLVCIVYKKQKLPVNK